MARETIPLNAPHYREPIEELHTLLHDAYMNSDGVERLVGIRAVFGLFPLAPTSDLVRRRLVRRGAIHFRRDQAYAWNDGAPVNATFHDDPFGSISIVIPGSLEATIATSGDELYFAITGELAIDVERLPELIGYNSRQSLTGLGVTAHSIGYYMQDRQDPGTKLLLLLETTSEVSEGPPKSMLAFAAMALSEDQCGGGGGPSTDACWWVVKTNFGPGRCWIQWSRRDGGVCEDPEVEMSESIVSGPHNSRDEARESMERNC